MVAAFHDQPELLILDEPTAGLDPVHPARVRELCERPAAKADGLHLVPPAAEIEHLCDRVGIIREGQLRRSNRSRSSKPGSPPPGDRLREACSDQEVRRPGGRRGLVLTVHATLHRRRQRGCPHQRSRPLQGESVRRPRHRLEEIFLGYYRCGRRHREGGRPCWLRSASANTVRDLRWPHVLVASRWPSAEATSPPLFPTLHQPSTGRDDGRDAREHQGKRKQEPHRRHRNQWIVTPRQFLNVELFPLNPAAPAAGFARGVVQRLHAGAEARGTIDSALYPVPRWRWSWKKDGRLLTPVGRGA